MPGALLRARERSRPTVHPASSLSSTSAAMSSPCSHERGHGLADSGAHVGREFVHGALAGDVVGHVLHHRGDRFGVVLGAAGLWHQVDVGLRPGARGELPAVGRAGVDSCWGACAHDG